MGVIFLASYSDQQKRALIMDHYLNPRFREETLVADTHTYYQHSSACVDQIWLQYNPPTCHYKATGCAIFLSACDIFIERLHEVGWSQRRALVAAFQALVHQATLAPDQLALLGKLQIYANVKRHLNRMECALLITQVLNQIPQD